MSRKKKQVEEPEATWGEIFEMFTILPRVLIALLKLGFVIAFFPLSLGVWLLYEIMFRDAFKFPKNPEG